MPKAHTELIHEYSIYCMAELPLSLPPTLFSTPPACFYLTYFYPPESLMGT